MVSMSKLEFDRLEVLLGVQSGRLRVEDACTLMGLSRMMALRAWYRGAGAARATIGCRTRSANWR